jgi:hypothetical protein
MFGESSPRPSPDNQNKAGLLFMSSLKEDFDDLMKVKTEHLKQALTENNIPFESGECARVSLVDLLVEELDQNQRKEIFMRYNGGGTPASSSRVSIDGS